ncbi:MAG: hypothetical protein AABW79_01245 [Nanoarchaeota archaeon]
MGVLRATGKRLYGGDYESELVRITDGKISIAFKPYELSGVGSAPYNSETTREELIAILDKKGATIAVPYKKGDSSQLVHLFNPKSKRLELGKLELIVSKPQVAQKSQVTENQTQQSQEASQETSELIKLEEVYQGEYGGSEGLIYGVNGVSRINISEIQQATRIGFIQVYLGNKRRSDADLAKEAREKGANFLALYPGNKKSKPGILLKLSEKQVREAKMYSLSIFKD